MARLIEERAEGDAKLVHRLVDNVRWLVNANGFTIARTAGLANMGASTLRKLLNQPEITNPGLETIEALAMALGVPDSAWLLLPLEELQTRVEEEGLRPFHLSRPAITSLRSSEASGAGKRKLGDALALLARAS